jgi:uncharacterized protein
MDTNSLTLTGWTVDPIGRQEFDGYLLTFLVDRPEDVRTVMAAATDVLKPARKALFGSFSGVHRSDDGALWKVSSEQRKDTGNPAAAPEPTELGVLLGVADVKAAARFHVAVGFTADRDYGSKYADFTRSGVRRLGLLPRAALAKDAGVPDAGTGSRGLTLQVSTPDPAGLLQRAASAGASSVDESGFTDPQGFRWQVAAA